MGWFSKTPEPSTEEAEADERARKLEAYRALFSEARQAELRQAERQRNLAAATARAENSLSNIQVRVNPNMESNSFSVVGYPNNQWDGYFDGPFGGPAIGTSLNNGQWQQMLKTIQDLQTEVANLKERLDMMEYYKED